MGQTKTCLICHKRPGICYTTHEVFVCTVCWKWFAPLRLELNKTLKQRGEKNG